MKIEVLKYRIGYMFFGFLFLILTLVLIFNVKIFEKWGKASVVLIEDGGPGKPPTVTFLINDEEYKATINFSKLTKSPSSSGVDFRPYSIEELHIDYLVSDPTYAMANRKTPLIIYSCIDSILLAVLIIIFILELKVRREFNKKF